MLKKWYCQADLTLRITPVDPILVKSGLAQATGSDMHPVVMKKNDGAPLYFLPGTSLKGVFRSHLERIGRTLAPGSVCIPYYDPEGTEADTIPVEDQQTAFGCSYLLRSESHKPTVYQRSCPVCRIFGLLGFGGRIAISDAIQVADDPPRKEIRDGVGINRFTGGSARGVLFNQEVLVGGMFETQMRVANFELWQLSALLHLLLDLKDGMLQVGSGRSRGLGRFTAEPTQFSLTYLRTGKANGLRGLFQLENDAARREYGFLDWTPDTEISLPTSEVRGLRVSHQIVDRWEQWASDLSDGFPAALDRHANNADVNALRAEVAS